MPPRESPSTTRPEELLRVAQEYADLFNANPLEDIDRLIADACVDPFWDDRTNLLSLLADEPEDLGLVLATGPRTMSWFAATSGSSTTCPSTGRRWKTGHSTPAPTTTGR